MSYDITSTSKKRLGKNLPKNNTTTLKRSLWNVSNDAVSDAVYWIKLF